MGARLQEGEVVRGWGVEGGKIDGSGEAHEDQCKSFKSQTSTVTSGAPQGSVPGRLLFTIYLFTLSNIFPIYGISFNRYADDTQL